MSDKDFIQDPDRGASDPFEQYPDFDTNNPLPSNSPDSDTFSFSDSDTPSSLPESSDRKDVFELDESLFSAPSDVNAPIFSFDSPDSASDRGEASTQDEANSSDVVQDHAVLPDDDSPREYSFTEGDAQTAQSPLAEGDPAKADTDSISEGDALSKEAPVTDDAQLSFESPFASAQAMSDSQTHDGTDEFREDAPFGDSVIPTVDEATSIDTASAHEPLTQGFDTSNARDDEASGEDTSVIAHSAHGDYPADAALTQTLPPAILPGDTSDNSNIDMFDNTSEEEDKPKRFGKKFVALLTGAVVLVALIAGAIGYYVYYQDRALPGTQLAGVDVSGKKQSDIEKLVSDKQKGLRVTFAGDIDNKQAFPLDKMGASIDPKKTAEKVLAPNASFGNYIKAPFSTRNIEPDYTIKPAEAAAFAVELSSSAPGAKDPVEPRVQLSDDKETFTVVEGEEGVGVDAKDIEAAAKQAITTFKNTSKKVTVAPTKPFLSVDDLKPIEEQANALSSLKVALTVGDKQVEPERSTKASWIVLPEAASDEKPTISDEGVRDWVDKQAASIAVEPKAGKQYVSSSGKVLKTESEPVDGKKVTNQEDIAKQIKSTMEENKAFEDALTTEVVKAEVDKKVIADGAENLAYMAAPGEKWVDINLSNRTVTPYVGATAQAGPFLMVPGLPATPTVTGSFKVWHKTRSQTMEGYNTDGSRYKVPGVQWNTFFHSGYAMHAAHWRSTFGPGAGGGSHGCVNMDFSGAKYIYEFAPIGTPVVSHY